MDRAGNRGLCGIGKLDLIINPVRRCGGKGEEGGGIIGGGFEEVGLGEAVWERIGV